MKVIPIFTTTSSSWYQEKADIVAKNLSTTKGREEIKFEVISIKAPKQPQIAPDKEGNMRISWDWMEYYFNTEGYDGLIFHFTPYYKKKWQLAPKINGSRYSQSIDRPVFWLCCEKEGREGYKDLSNFERILYHEWGHYDEDLDMALPQESVHNMDYKLKAIDLHHKIVDLRPYNFNKKIQPLLEKIVYLMKYVLPKS